LDVLFPHLAGVVVERIERIGSTVWIWASPRAVEAACPGCSKVSDECVPAMSAGLPTRPLQVLGS
jgi:hypothetical protein